MPDPNKSLLLAINFPLKILTNHLQDHHTHYSTDMNQKPDLKSEATIKTHRLQNSKNHMADFVPPPTPGGYRTTPPSSGVRIIDKPDMKLTSPPPN